MHGDARYYSDIYYIKSDKGRKLNYKHSGNLTKKKHYLYGQEHGTTTSYYPNGRIWREETYINGKKEGTEKYYFDKV